VGDNGLAVEELEVESPGAFDPAEATLLGGDFVATLPVPEKIAVQAVGAGVDRPVRVEVAVEGGCGAVEARGEHIHSHAGAEVALDFFGLDGEATLFRDGQEGLALGDLVGEEDRSEAGADDSDRAFGADGAVFGAVLDAQSALSDLVGSILVRTGHGNSLQGAKLVG